MDLARKLGIRPGTRLATIDAPLRFDDDMQPLPPGVEQLTLDDKDLDCIVIFVTSRAEVASAVARVLPCLAATGNVWVAWPKQLSGYSTDMSVEVAQAAGMRFGLLDTRRLSLNDGWTSMRFIVRPDDRAGWSKRSFDK